MTQPRKRLGLGGWGVGLSHQQEPLEVAELPQRPGRGRVSSDRRGQIAWQTGQDQAAGKGKQTLERGTWAMA
jgi:hypothetical protein